MNAETVFESIDTLASLGFTESEIAAWLNQPTYHSRHGFVIRYPGDD